MSEGISMTARNFVRREVYHSADKLGYACWVSFFPGENGKWHISFEEVSIPEEPLPKMSREKWYSFSLPYGYDKSQYKMEMVITESDQAMERWEVISRQPCRFQHSAGSFGQAYTKNGRFIRFVWSAYSLDDDEVGPGEILHISSDNGKTWEKQPPLLDARFSCFPHRLRTLSDGTLVIAVPVCPPFSVEQPRAKKNLNAISEWLMCLFFSYDQGMSWTGPLPVLNGQEVTETDFVELPSGDLLMISSSIWAHPGRQVIYRTKNGFMPGPYEKAVSYDIVPETVCITEDGLLVGCHRFPGKTGVQYAWSDDLGLNWFPIYGIVEKTGYLYQPWIHYIGNGRFACAGHVGGDEPVKGRDPDRDQCILLHQFELKDHVKTRDTDLKLLRDYDESSRKYLNSYKLTLTCDKKPLAGKELEIWFAERDKPGYDSFAKYTIDERMKMGGETVTAVTDEKGEARISLGRFDSIDYIHHCIQIVARFNNDRKYEGYKPVQTAQFTFYSVGDWDPEL